MHLPSLPTRLTASCGDGQMAILFYTPLLTEPPGDPSKCKEILRIHFIVLLKITKSFDTAGLCTSHTGLTRSPMTGRLCQVFLLCSLLHSLLHCLCLDTLPPHPPPHTAHRSSRISSNVSSQKLFLTPGQFSNC